MTNSALQPAPTLPPSRLRLPGVASVLFVASPILLLVGGFLAQVNASLTFDWAIFQTRLGTVMFWFGVASLMTALVLVGVRSIAQQQLNLLLNVERDQHGRCDNA